MASSGSCEAGVYLYWAYSWAPAQIGLVPCPLSAVVFAVGEDLRLSGTLTVRSSKEYLYRVSEIHNKIAY